MPVLRLEAMQVSSMAPFLSQTSAISSRVSIYVIGQFTFANICDWSKRLVPHGPADNIKHVFNHVLNRNQSEFARNSVSHGWRQLQFSPTSLIGQFKFRISSLASFVQNLLAPRNTVFSYV